MDVEIIRRICLARHLYELGNSCLKSDNDLYLFSAANLLQDAVEAFLLAVAGFLKIDIPPNTNFDKYFTLINGKTGQNLPFKNKLICLNKVRVNSKHYGIQPARDECNRLVVAVREFFEEVSSSILSVNFSTVSAIDLLRDGEVKDLLYAAKSALEQDNFKECAIFCRKAIFLELEKDYSIRAFKDGEQLGLLGGSRCQAPYFTKNKEYIDKHVGNPTDYIVIDHSHLDQELLKYKIDNTAFWNVWRLTPEVYKTQSGDWVVKHDFNKLEPILLEDKIEYVFNATVDIILAVHTNRGAAQFIVYQKYCLELKEEEVPVYEKADSQSRIVEKTPPGLKKLGCEFYVVGLQGDGPYWRVLHLEGDLLLSGYIHNDFVK